MNRPKHAKIILCLCFLTVGVWHVGLQPEPLQAQSAPAVGRENPFAKLPKKKPPPQKVSQSSQSNEEMPELPELFVEIVTLKSLNAESLVTVVKEMLSERGSISTDSETNSLIIRDTKENLEKILAQIQNIDKATKAPEQLKELFVETVTLKFLDAENLETALKSMSSEYGSISVDKKSNSLIICDTKENLEKILAQVQNINKATKAPEQLKELFVETVTLKFLDAKNLETALKSMSSEYGSISVDKKSNSLIICDTKENLELILAEVRRADKTPQQIMVEVVILDVQLYDDTEIGINWDILSDKTYDIGYRQNFTTSRLTSTIEDADTIGDATAFVTRGLGGDFSIISGTIRNIVHLIQQKREVEILASPRVMMVSGQSAYIEAVEELPYTEVSTYGAGGELETTEFKDVGIKLTVSAILTDNNDILLTVDAEQNVKTGESDTQIPIVDTRKANTSLLLKDGQVVIFGGLRRQEKTKEVKQIPIIGDLPIIGELFKSTSTVVKNSELIVFLSPHIYQGEPIPDEAMAKFKEIKDRPMLSLREDRDATKKRLLKKIRRLQKQKGEDAAGELMSTLNSLDKILSQEVQESLDASETPLAGRKM